MRPEIIAAVIAAVVAVTGGGGLAGLIARRQNNRAEARAVEGREYREWAIMDRKARERYEEKLDELRVAYGKDRDSALTCAGGDPCPTRSIFLANRAPDPTPPVEEGATAA